jgi:hypothetical protein
VHAAILFQAAVVGTIETVVAVYDFMRTAVLVAATVQRTHSPIVTIDLIKGTTHTAKAAFAESTSVAVVACRPVIEMFGEAAAGSRVACGGCAGRVTPGAVAENGQITVRWGAPGIGKAVTSATTEHAGHETQQPYRHA